MASYPGMKKWVIERLISGSTTTLMFPHVVKHFGYQSDIQTFQKYCYNLKTYLNDQPVEKTQKTRMSIDEKEQELVCYFRDTDGDIPDWLRVEMDVRGYKTKTEFHNLNIKYKRLMLNLDAERKKNNVLMQVNPKSVKPIKLDAPVYSGTSTSTAVAVLSDWHIDELVEKNSVNGLNEFNSEIAEYRAKKLFEHLIKVIKIERNGTKIETLVLALLGDFISGHIHEELMENNTMTPPEAIVKLLSIFKAGINYLIEYGGFKQIIIPCCTGNHSRTSKKIKHSTGFKNNFEYILYHALKSEFESNEIVDFHIAESYHQYVTVNNYIMRFHHGNAIRYLGGIGGLFVPANRAVMQWNKAKPADLDIFGHLHQAKDGGFWVSNSSLVGYNPFALSIKADYEEPSQTFFLINHKRQRRLTTRLITLD